MGNADLIGEKLCRKRIYEDRLNIQHVYKDTAFLKQLDVDRFIDEINNILVQYILDLSAVNLKEENEQVKSAVAEVLEGCYYLRNFHLVLPHSFLCNFIQSCSCGSKSVSVVNGKIFPGGSSKTLKSWLNSHGGVALHMMKGLIDIF